MGDADTIEFVHDLNIYTLLIPAIRHNNFRGVTKLVELGAIISNSTIENSIQSCSRKMVKHLIKLSTNILNNLLLIAAQNNNNEVGEFLVDRGADINYALIGAAAGNYPFQVKKWIRRETVEYDEALFTAIENGGEKVIKPLIKVNEAMLTFIDLPNLDNHCEVIQEIMRT